MLLIDKLINIIHLKSATAIVNVKKTSFFVQGHFPGQPVMPGVLIVEAFGQAAAALTASGIDMQEEVKNQFGFEFDFYTCDETALKTIIRSNPGALEIKSGTIVNKWHYNDFNKIKFD